MKNIDNFHQNNTVIVAKIETYLIEENLAN